MDRVEEAAWSSKLFTKFSKIIRAEYHLSP